MTSPQSLLAAATKSSKKEDVPGTVSMVLDQLCPVCGKRMKKYKPCCGSPTGYKGCSCGYKIQLKEGGG